MGSKRVESFDLPLKQQEIIRWREAKRLQLRNTYLRQVENPIQYDMVTDEAIQRYATMRMNPEYHFKLSPKSSLYGFFLPIGAIICFTWWVKSGRDAQEHRYRTGQVSYADRDMKFV